MNISYVVCTLNPDPGRLNEVLLALLRQDEFHDSEIVIVDNGSTPPIENTLFNVPLDRIRIIREPTNARPDERQNSWIRGISRRYFGVC